MAARVSVLMQPHALVDRYLTLLDDNGQVMADMTQDELKLGYFSPMNGWSTLPRLFPESQIQSPASCAMCCYATVTLQRA